MSGHAESQAIYPWTLSSYLFVAALLALFGNILQVLNVDENFIVAAVVSSVVVVYFFELVRPTTAIRVALVAGSGMGTVLIHSGLSSSSNFASRILFVAAGVTLWLELLVILRFAWVKRYGSTHT